MKSILSFILTKKPFLATHTILRKLFHSKIMTGVANAKLQAIWIFKRDILFSFKASILSRKKANLFMKVIFSMLSTCRMFKWFDAIGKFKLTIDWKLMLDVYLALRFGCLQAQLKHQAKPRPSSSCRFCGNWGKIVNTAVKKKSILFLSNENSKNGLIDVNLMGFVDLLRWY